MTQTTNYLREAADDAADTVRNFADEILEQLLDKGEASDDLLNDYPNGDAWHHECHVDKDYSLIDAATLLDQLMDFEETDSGLWEGLEPRRAIAAQAAYTYGNAVYSEWRELIEKINSEASDIIDTYDQRIAELEDADDPDNDDADGAEEGRQADIDSLEEEKKEALRKMIDELADNA